MECMTGGDLWAADPAVNRRTGDRVFSWYNRQAEGLDSMTHSTWLAYGLCSAAVVLGKARTMCCLWMRQCAERAERAWESCVELPSGCLGWVGAHAKANMGRGRLWL